MQQRLWTIFAGCIALSARVWAADSCTSTNGFTIASQADADALGKCGEYTGDVFISFDAAGNITIDGLVTLHGGLSTAPGGGGGGGGSTDSTSLIGIISETLETIDGDLSITDFKGLQVISLPKLLKVGGAVEFQRLPALTDALLRKINSLASLSLVSLPSVRSPSIGSRSLSEDFTKGLKHITSPTDAKIEVRDVGFVDMGGIMDYWNATLFSLEDAPNMDQLLILVGHVGEVRISGNGNLTLYMPEKGWSGDVPPVMEKLTVTGIKHISPCLWPEVWDFVAYNNTVQYLRFGFRGLRRLEVRDNPNMKSIVPFNGENLWRWNLSTMLVHDNPLLELTQYPVRPENDLTLLDCPYMFNGTTDQWQWYPFSLETIDISANVDNSFFSSFIELWTNVSSTLSSRNSRGRVTKNFSVNSTDPTFDCSRLDGLRRGWGTFPGEYTCQGKTLPVGTGKTDSSSSRVLAASSWSTLSLALAIVTAVVSL